MWCRMEIALERAKKIFQLQGQHMRAHHTPAHRQVGAPYHMSTNKTLKALERVHIATAKVYSNTISLVRITYAN